MKRNQDDRWIQIAFGETDGTEDAASVEPRLAEYRAIRQGLNLLKDVPEDQLSKERLRDAILKRGLSTEKAPKPTGFSLATMAVAACALAFGMVTVSRMGGPTPTLVEDPNSLAKVASLDATLKPPVAEPVPNTGATSAALVQPEANAMPNLDSEQAAKKRVRVASSGRRNIRPAAKPEPSVVADRAVNPSPTEPRRDEPAEVLVATSAANTPVSSTPETPIVLIEPSPDAAGTRATERETFTNVLVGG